MMRYQIQSSVEIENDGPIPVYTVEVPGFGSRTFRPTEAEDGMDRETLCATLVGRAHRYANEIVLMREAMGLAESAVGQAPEQRSVYAALPTFIRRSWSRGSTSLSRRRTRIGVGVALILGLAGAVWMRTHNETQLLPSATPNDVASAPALPTEAELSQRRAQVNAAITRTAYPAAPLTAAEVAERRSRVRAEGVNIVEALYSYRNGVGEAPSTWEELVGFTGWNLRHEESLVALIGRERNLADSLGKFWIQGIVVYDKHRPEDRCVGNVVARTDRLPLWRVEHFACSWEDPLLAPLHEAHPPMSLEESAEG